MENNDNDNDNNNDNGLGAKKKTREEGDRGCVSRTTTRDPGNT